MTENTDTTQNDGVLEEAQTIDACRAKAAEYLAGWKRAIADYQNREKELAQEKQVLAAYAATAVIEDFLPVLDNLREAMTHVPETNREEGWVKGMGYITTQFEDVMKKFGMTPFRAVGLPFDPARHEAVGEAEGEAGIVVREVAAGYEHDGHLIRPAKVIVGKIRE